MQYTSNESIINLVYQIQQNEHNAELKHSIGGVGAEHVCTTGDGYFWNQKAHYIHYQWS